MKSPSRLAVTVLTHGLAIAGGWAIYQGTATPHVAGESVPAAKSAKATERGTAEEVSGREVLAEILKPADDPFSPGGQGWDPYDNGKSSEIPQTRQEIRDRIDSIAIPADFAAALADLMSAQEKDGAWTQDSYLDTAALAFHWMSKDPKAFYEWLNADRKRLETVGNTISELGPELYKRLGAEGVLPMIGVAGSMNYQMGSMLARSVAKTGDTPGVMKAKEMLSGENWQYFSRNVGSEWPNEKLDELVKLAVACDEPLMAIGHKLHGKDQGGYIAGLLADESLPEDFRQRIGDNEFARQGLARDPSVPLELRLQSGGNIDQVMRSDVDRIMTEERDWAYAFRHGEASAQEVLDAIRAGTPEIAEKQPEALRSWIFRELAEENPAEAMALLKDMPEEERDPMVLYHSRTHFNDVEPSKFLEMMQQIPSDTPEQWEGRLDAWNRRGFTNHERLQDGYVEWVQALPPGLDREMGLYSLARAVQLTDRQLAAQIRSQVTDPELQKRISENR